MVLLCCAQATSAQQVWTLEQCIAYAIKHNVQIKLGDLTTAQNQIAEQQANTSRYPTVNGGFANGVSFGRSINPITNQFVQQGYYYNGFNLGADVLVFGWFSRKYQQQQASLQTLATKQQNMQLQSDLSLNIATAYLRILLAKEQEKLSQQQLQTDADQAVLIKRRADAGGLPQLNYAQMQAQLSQDSSNVLNASLAVQAALIDLKSILNMPMSESLDVVVPQITSSSIAGIYPSAQEIFEEATKHQFRLQQANYNIEAAKEQVKIAKAAKYPTVTAGWSLGTNFASTVKDVTGFTQIGEEAIGNIKFGDSLIPITRPTYSYTTRLTPIFRQYGNNLRQSVNLNVSVPIFNGYQAKYNIQRAELGVQQQQFVQEQNRNQLMQDVYRAYNDYQSSLQRYKAAQQQVQSAELALQYAQKRLDAGLLATQEYITQQNTLQRAQNAAVQSKYEAVFKGKILDFYLNRPIQL
ncbi:MAG: hypothetical protein RL660_262 [Bacteroidota bacterium]|jgi:outer membrane protein